MVYAKNISNCNFQDATLFKVEFFCGLIRYSIDISASENKDQKTLLHYCMMWGDFKMFYDIFNHDSVDKYEILNHRDSDRRTPMDLAVIYGKMLKLCFFL